MSDSVTFRYRVMFITLFSTSILPDLFFVSSLPFTRKVLLCESGPFGPHSLELGLFSNRDFGTEDHTYTDDERPTEVPCI